MRVVLDTNVLVSGLLWSGAPNQLLKWTRDGSLEALSGESAIAEVRRVLEYPKFATRISTLESSPELMIAYLMNLVTHVPQLAQLPAVVSDDPSDNLFLALATENHGRLIVSGDQHLLSLNEHQGIPIVSPGEALDLVRRLYAQ